MKSMRKYVSVLIVMALVGCSAFLNCAERVFAEEPVSSSVYTYYLPYCTANSSEWSGVGFSNDNTTSTANVKFIVYDKDGVIITTEDKVLPPNGQEAFVVGTGISSDGWMKAESDQALSGLSFTGTSGANNHLAQVPIISTTSKNLVIPHVAQGNSWDTEIFLANPNDIPASVSLSYCNSNGSVMQDSYKCTISSNGSKRIKVSELIGADLVENGKVTLSSPVGIVAFAIFKSDNCAYSGVAAFEPDFMANAVKYKEQQYEDIVSIACVNFNPVVGNKIKTVEKMQGFTREAVQAGANIVVFPELALTGVFAPDQLNIVAETIPGPSTTSMAGIAAELDVYIVFGMVELEGETLYNTAVVIGPEGILGKHHKVHPIEFLEPWAAKGKSLDLFQTPYGPIGISICYSSYCFPEVARSYAVQGARIMINASAFPNFPDCDDYKSFYMTTLGARATENSMFVASANIVGLSGGVPFFGYSTILGPKPGKMDYHIYAGPGSDTEEGVVLATVNLKDSEQRPQAVQTILRDRNPDVYPYMVVPTNRFR